MTWPLPAGRVRDGARITLQFLREFPKQGLVVVAVLNMTENVKSREY